MFEGISAAHDLNAAPWDDESFDERLDELLKGTGRRVAYLYGTPDNSTFRYRVYNMVEALRYGDFGIHASWFKASEIRELRRVLHRLDVLVLARLQFSRDVSDIISAARASSVRVLFECDDLVFDLTYAQLVSENNDLDFDWEDHLNNWFAYVARCSVTALHCDGGITTNSFLAEKMAHVIKGPIGIVPNFLNKRQEDFSRILLKEKATSDFARNDRLTIGYFSGSPSHNNDFKCVADTLSMIMEDDPFVDLRVVGYLPALDAFERFGDRLEQLPFQDWVSLQKTIAQVEINIAPLGLNDFTKCKSELKYFEAAAVGTYSIVSRTPPFEASAGQSKAATVIENGFWQQALIGAISRVRNEGFVGKTVVDSAEVVFARYGWNRNTDAIIRALS